MSHASVLIVTEEKPTEEMIEELMLPYQEYGATGIINEYVQWLDKTDVLMEEYKTSTRNAVRKISDNSLYCPYDTDMLYREPTDEELIKINDFHNSEVEHTKKDWNDGKGYRAKVKYIPEGYEKCKVTFEEFYGDFEKFVRDWHGFAEENFKGDKVGYYDNPNSKWDWYQIGGRFSGHFQAKNEDEAENGEKSWTNKDQEITGVDIIQKKNIDVESMIENAKQETEKCWNILLKHYPDLTKFPTKSWQDCITEYEKEHGEFNREGVKKLFESQENYDNDAISALDKELGLFFDNSISFYCKGDKEAFYKKMLYNQFGTFAILKDKHWYQQGQLGWFGTSSTEDANWDETYYEIFESIDDEHWLTIVDYHC